MGFIELTVIITLGICIRLSSSEPHNTDKWVRPASFPQSNHQNLLLGIDQRLRGIDTIRHIISRNEMSLDSLSNRIELMETRLTSLHNTMQHKFEAIVTAVSSAEMKYELYIDQMSRKLHTELDRIYHKLNSAEARLETTANKLQNQMEINFQKAETKQNNIANDISKVHSGIEMLNSQSIHAEQRYNRTLGILVNHLQEIRHEHADKKEHLKNLTSLVTGLQTNKSEMWTQSDAPMLPKQQIQIIKAEISIEAQKIATKLSNMYNDMWRNIKDLEVIFKLALNESGNKSIELHHELQEMIFQDKTDSENFLDFVIRSVMSSIQTELSNMKMQFKTEFQRLIEINEINGDSCQRVVKGMIENGTLVLVLEKMLVTLTNRTDKLTKQITEVGEQVKKSNYNIITLGKDNNQQYKKLDSSINDVSEKTDEISQELQIQAQDIEESLVKHQKLIKELKVLFSNNLECNKPLPSETMKSNLNALEANYSNGVIKIVTDHANKTDGTADKEDERLTKSMGIPLAKLNQSISTSDLIAVIGESKNNKHEPQTTLAASEEKDEDDDFEAQEEFVEEDSKNVDQTQLLLSYIKYLRGHLTAQEFLAEAVPGNKYENLREMARQLKRTGNVPKEMIKNIEDMALEQTDKDSIGIDKEIGNIIRKLSQHNKYETFNEDENYDEPLDTTLKE